MTMTARNMRSAIRRAEARGVDLMQIQPQSLRTKTRLSGVRANNQVRRAWVRTGHALRDSMDRATK